MASVMTMDRPMLAGTPAPGMSMPGSAPGTAAPSHLAVPQCTLTCERCDGGCRINCRCDDEVACATLQHLCRALASGCCSVSCIKNGICLMQCNLAMCNCTCECTKDGVCITCRSGDKECCSILQSCCDSICACLAAGCCCYVCFNNTPVCCGCC